MKHPSTIIKHIVIGILAALVIIIFLLFANIVGWIHMIPPANPYDIAGDSVDGVITCYADEDGFLSVNITDPGESKWKYEQKGSTEKLLEKKTDFDGYHFLIQPTITAGKAKAVVGEYDYEDRDNERHSRGIVTFKVEGGKVVEILKVTHAVP